ncbi:MULTISPECIES: hypothetical protein [unclassified Rathayibacter]|uniref:hypothetical protein n=1 Tax=unclassified Rathayibacter TaxID=2609250 RepID=UPI001046A30B|nr:MULTISPECIES: hypothetical protein [unclassified Rathayibacter]QHC68760.1 hypothetical protein GSU68_18835 [Rathayibacter sp. VKM Ac-2759]TCL77902.1 hypothetical protein EDF49_11445 [Rathayibacter sp. PhB192]TCM23754.1 hypothetical protein EDF43_11441 [Rathayibacter sp. PhB179]
MMRILSSTPAPVMRAVMVVLTLMALLLGVFAMQSMMGSHTDTTAVSDHAYAQSAAHAEASPVARPAETHHSAGDSTPGVLVPMIPCDESCAMSCALMAATCVIVFLLTALVLLARTPALYARVLDAGPQLVRLLPRARFHIYLPSLTVLSISRT